MGLQKFERSQWTHVCAAVSIGLLGKRAEIEVVSPVDGILIEAQWLPALEKFKPEMIFISAGFDAHCEDLLGGMALVEDDYAWITREMMAVAARHSQQRVVSMLEGGYNLSALGRSVVAHVKTLTEH